MDSGCTRMSPMTLWFCGSVPLLNIQNANTPALFGRFVLIFLSYRFKFEQSVKSTVFFPSFMEREVANSNWSIHGLEFLFPYQTCYSLNILQTKYAYVCSILLS